MSKYLNHSERIASYLDGQMSPGQMQEFEKQLHTDPVLRSEFELQKDIVHTLKDFRKTQLKTRLDQVPVSVGPGIAVGVKAAAALVISGIVGLGAYLYFNTSEDESGVITESIAPIEQQVNPETLIQLPDELPVEDEIATETVAEPVQEATEEIVALSQPEMEMEEAPVESTVTDQLETKTDPVIRTPNLIDPSIYQSEEVEETIEMPTASLAQDGLLENNVVAVETARRDSDMFHYQYYSGKLYLYGDFRDNPYEILELNSAQGKRLFIYYNGAYFKINDNQQEITPLEKLNNQETIKKLEIIQANK